MTIGGVQMFRTLDRADELRLIASTSILDDGLRLTERQRDGRRALDHHHADLGDVRLHYVTAGSGFPVVLLHGWPQSCVRMAPGSWVRQRFRVIAPDLRGLGN